MGYTTEFRGEFIFNKPLTKKQTDYIRLFTETRRMKRDTNALNGWFKGDKGLVGRTKDHYGIDGEFFVGGIGFMGQDTDPSVIDSNEPPSTQPGLWCQWITDGKTLYWNGSEKFYNYIEWLKYMMENFFIPWGIVLDGKVYWRGEDWIDQGIIELKNNSMIIYTNKMGDSVPEYR